MDAGTSKVSGNARGLPDEHLIYVHESIKKIKFHCLLFTGKLDLISMMYSQGQKTLLNSDSVIRKKDLYEDFYQDLCREVDDIIKKLQGMKKDFKNDKGIDVVEASGEDVDSSEMEILTNVVGDIVVHMAGLEQQVLSVQASMDTMQFNYPLVVEVNDDDVDENSSE